MENFVDFFCCYIEHGMEDSGPYDDFRKIINKPDNTDPETIKSDLRSYFNGSGYKVSEKEIEVITENRSSLKEKMNSSIDSDY